MHHHVGEYIKISEFLGSGIVENVLVSSTGWLLGYYVYLDIAPPKDFNEGKKYCVIFIDDEHRSTILN